jgi:excisionase family DNA binding protein
MAEKTESKDAKGHSLPREEGTGAVPATSELLPSERLRLNPPVLMNEREVALVLNVCPRSIRNFTARRLLPVIRLGRRRLFRRDAVLAALQALEHGGVSGARIAAYSARK